MCLQYIDIKQKKLKQFYHNPRVGGSSPSSARIIPMLVVTSTSQISQMQIKWCLCVTLRLDGG
jgi:hypothetical protein